MWTAWILGSAFFLALYDLAKKASVKENEVLPVLLVSTFCGSLGFTAWMAARGVLPSLLAETDGRVLAFGLSKSLIVGTSWIFTFCGLRTLPISIATPIRASAPALVFLFALFLYGEIPSVVQGAGMLTVFGGYFAFSWAGQHEGIDFLRNRAVWCAVAGAFFSAISAVWDKYIFQVANAPREAVQLVFQGGLIFFYGAVLLAQRGLRLLLALADWLYFRSISFPDVPISVASLMRRFSVVITFVLGAKVFRETNLRRKALALAAILLGVILLRF